MNRSCGISASILMAAIRNGVGGLSAPMKSSQPVVPSLRL